MPHFSVSRVTLSLCHSERSAARMLISRDSLARSEESRGYFTFHAVSGCFHVTALSPEVSAQQAREKELACEHWNMNSENPSTEGRTRDAKCATV